MASGNPLKKVRTGDALHVPAAAYNAFVDAAVAEQRRQQQMLSNLQRAPWQQAGIVLVRNDSGAAVGRYQVLGVAGSVIAPADNLGEFQRQVALSGVTSTVGDHLHRFVVTLEPIDTGRIGRAVAGGVVPVQVDVAADVASARYAAPAGGSGVVTHLSAGLIGSAAILWREGGTGVQWAIVRLGPEAHPPAATFAVRLWQDGGTTDGDKTTPCDRTYTVRTLEASGPSTGGLLLGSGMTPQKRRPAAGKLSVPAASGGGEIGTAYCDASGICHLLDANEVFDTSGC